MIVVHVVETRDSFDSSGSDSGSTFPSMCDDMQCICACVYSIKLSIGVV